MGSHSQSVTKRGHAPITALGSKARRLPRLEPEQAVGGVQDVRGKGHPTAVNGSSPGVGAWAGAGMTDGAVTLFVLCHRPNVFKNPIHSSHARAREIQMTCF